jgi:flavin-dependent dehydrogenase
VDADLSPGRGVASIEAAGLVDVSTGEGIYYADATGASAAQATYVEV